MAHSHSHSHHHHNGGALRGKNLLLSIFLNVLITAAQAVGGFLSGSLSLLSDALHNLSDVLSLVISYVANRFAGKEASTARTFGYKRAEIMAAFVNSASLIVIALFLIREAIERFLQPQEIGTGIVIVLSFLGILANGFSVWLLKGDADHNMNMRSAYLHLLSDMMASVAVLAGGLLMYFFELWWIDPVLTILIAIYLVYMGYDLLRTSTRVLMLFTPDSIKVAEIVHRMSALNGIRNIHHVHIWQLNDNAIHMEAHVDFDQDIPLSEFEPILRTIEEVAYHDFGISHVTIQPEHGRCADQGIIASD